MALSKPFDWSGTEWVYCVCAVHLVACVAILASTTPGAQLQIGNVFVSPLAQWINGTFCVVSIISIIAAAVGALFLIEWHLNVYYYVLLVSGVVDVALLVYFITHGEACETLIRNAEIEKSSQSCGFTVTAQVIALTLLGIFKFVGMSVVTKAKKVIRMKYGEELLPHMRKSLQQSFGDFSTGFVGADDEGFAEDPSAAQPFLPASGDAEADYGSAQASLRSRLVSRPTAVPAPSSAPQVPVAGGTPTGAAGYSAGAAPVLRSSPAALHPAATLPPRRLEASLGGPPVQPVLSLPA